MSYEYIKQNYYELLIKELKGYKIAYDLKEMYKYIIINKLDIDKLSQILRIDVNYDGITYQHKKNKDTQKYLIKSMKNYFKIYFLPNSPLKAYNPLFPIIEIKVNNKINKKPVYFQIVRYKGSQSYDLGFYKERYMNEDLNTNTFIDTINDNKLDNYPYYTCEHIFTDSPLWYHANFLNIMPLDKWIANVYAIIDDGKNITVLGGINWGFKFIRWSIIPIAIHPTALGINDFKKDWKIFYPILKKYKGSRNVIYQ
jgi:hypothetical protein